MGKEKNFENKIKKFLKSQGIYPFGTSNDKMTVPIIGYYEKRFANRMTKRGLPDLSIVINGYSLEVEVKCENGKSSEMQLFNRNLIREAGGICIVIYPDQFEMFKELVSFLKRGMYKSSCKAFQYQFDKK